MKCHLFTFLLLIGGATICLSPAAWSQVPNTTRTTLPTMSQCASCHVLHGGYAYILQDPQKDMVCRSCHDPDVAPPAKLVPTQYQARIHTGPSGGTYWQIPGNPSSGPYTVQCTQCHNPHYYVKNLRGLASGQLPTDPGPPSQQNCADTAGNTQICLNFKMLGTIKVDAAGTRKSLADDTYPVRLLTPGSSDTLANCLASGTNSNPANPGIPVYDSLNNYLGCARIYVAGRRLPLTVGSGKSAVTYNDWTSPTKPFQGVCNQCHTRTQHHRNNDNTTGDPCQPQGNDHTHNATRRCTECHDHLLNFSKNQTGSCPSQ